MTMDVTKTTKILALDASTVAIGWAVMDYNTVHEYGVYHLKTKELITRLVDASWWMKNMGANKYVDAVAIETPVLHGKHRNVQTTIHLAYMVGALIAAVMEYIPIVCEVRPGERLSALGLSIRTPRDEAKELVRQRVNAIYSLDIPPKDNDASDAIAVGYAAIKQMMLEELKKE